LTVALLSIRNLSKSFGGIKAVNDVSFDIAGGTVVGLIGPNGAGKTALINLISGFYTDATGSIILDGEEILNRSIHRIARRGISRTFQNIRLIPRLTVLENVLLAFQEDTLRPLRSFFKLDHRVAAKRALDYLEFVGLRHRADHLAGTLAYGEARRLEIVRGLARHPKLLVMDEPAAGMNEAETAELIELIRSCRSHVSSILLIEHDITMVRTLSDGLIAMNDGAKIAEGPPEIVLNDPAVRAAYMGADN